MEEVVVSTVVGLAISTILNMTLLPAVVGVPVSLGSNILLTAVFTVASITRGYFIRRHYNRKIKR